MFISEETAKNLDLDFVLDKVTVYTPYGKELKKSMGPFSIDEKDELIKEFDKIQRVVQLIERQRYTFIELRNYFKHMKDLSLTFKRIKDNEVLSITELYEVKLFIGMVKRIKESLDKLKWEVPKDISPEPIEYLEGLFDPQGSGTNTFYIYDEYSKDLSEIRSQIKEVEAEISKKRKEIKNQVENDLGIKLRPNGEMIVNKTSSELIDRLKSYDLLAYGAETYMNVTFKIKSTQEIDTLTSKLEKLKELEEEEEYTVRGYLSKEIREYLDVIEKNTRSIGKLDLLIAKSYHAIGYNGVRPQIEDNNHIYIENGRHIKVEQNLRKEDREFTPITVDIKNGVTCITGANMGGKTVALKLIGLLSVMAQYGMFVPAERMSFSMKEFVFFSLGDMQSTDMGLSTFGGEIIKIKEAIGEAQKEGLILIDELARGTNPTEGFAISKAIINYLKNKNTITIITTHFDGLTDHKDVKHLQVKGLSEADFKEISANLKETKGSIKTLHEYMDYRLQEVKDTKQVPKDAINISRLMGLDEEILKDAEEILKTNGG